eukprot:SAG22_NODE_9330_length_596_cov_0.593561_1_plen_45_part_10
MPYNAPGGGRQGQVDRHWEGDGLELYPEPSGRAGQTDRTERHRLN